MKDFVAKDASPRWKTIITGKSLSKMEKKVMPDSQKLSCPLGRMSLFSQNCFLLIPIMVSASSEIGLTKK